jgi:hypothetical protein
MAIPSIELTALSTIMRNAATHTCFRSLLLRRFSRWPTNMSSCEKGGDAAEEHSA